MTRSSDVRCPLSVVRCPGLVATDNGPLTTDNGRRSAVFLDRDGVLNRTVVRDGVPHPPDHLGEFELLPGVADATARLAASFPLVVVTNQRDVARGTQTRERVNELNDRLSALLPILDVCTCFHDTPDGCGCRKPKPGMLLAAAERWRLDLKRSFLVG